MVPAPQADSLGSAEAVAEGKRSDPGVAERHSLGHPGQEEEDMPQVPVPLDRVRWVLRPVSDSMSGEDMTSSRWGRLRQTCPEAVGDRNTHRKRGAEMADRGHHRTRHHPRSLVRHPLVQNELKSQKRNQKFRRRTTHAFCLCRAASSPDGLLPSSRLRPSHLTSAASCTYSPP